MLPVIPQDKANHIAYGAVVGVIAFVVGALVGLPVLQASLVSGVVVAIVAAGKELMDRRNPNHTPEWLDLFATVVGGALVLAPVLFAKGL